MQDNPFIHINRLEIINKINCFRHAFHSPYKSHAWLTYTRTHLEWHKGKFIFVPYCTFWLARLIQFSNRLIEFENDRQHRPKIEIKYSRLTHSANLQTCRLKKRRRKKRNMSKCTSLIFEVSKHSFFAFVLKRSKQRSKKTQSMYMESLLNCSKLGSF